MLYFLDTSALLKHYRKEAGTEFIETIFQNQESILTISTISVLEAISALDRLFRRGLINQKELEQSLSLLENELSSMRIGVIEQTPSHVLQAKSLIIEHHLASNDALILATALALKPYPHYFVTSDIVQLHAAESCGLKILNPLSSP